MIVHNIEQGSQEWHAIRYGKIGGSSLKELMVGKELKDSAIFAEILSAQFEPYQEEYQFKSEAMQRGNDLEPQARLFYELLNDVDVVQIGWAEMDNGIAGISPDGLVGSNGAVEFKCPTRKQHTGYILEPESLVKDYFWQIVQYFVVFDDIEWVDICSFRPECSYKPFLDVRVNKDTEIKLTPKNTLKISEAVEQAKYKINQLKTELEKWQH